MKFTEFVNHKDLGDSLLENVDVEELDSLNEELELIEGQLNEFLGLGKLAEKVKKGAERISNFSNSADKKIEDTKTAAKDYVEKKKNDIKNDIKGAGYALERGKNQVKGAIEKKVEDIKSGAAAKKEEIDTKRKEVSDKFGRVLKGAKNVFTKFGQVAVEALTPEQKELAKELSPVFGKLKRGGVLTGDQAIMVIAAVLAGITHGEDFPTKKAFDKQLKALRSQPGLSSFGFSVSYNRGASEVKEEEQKEVSKPTPKTKATPKAKVEEPEEEVVTPRKRTSETAAKDVVRNIRKK